MICLLAPETIRLEEDARAACEFTTYHAYQLWSLPSAEYMNT